MTEYQIPGRVPDDSTPRDAVSNYWRERYTAEPYYDDQLFFEDYEPAYRIGHAARAQDMIRAYEQVEAELESRWASEPAAAGWNGRRHAMPCAVAGRTRSRRIRC